MRASESERDSCLPSGYEAPCPSQRPDSDTETTVRGLRALAHPIRFRILEMLAQKERPEAQSESSVPTDEVCVCRLNEAFDIAAPTLSHHLKLLREAGLIEGRREGVWIYYSIRAGALMRLAQCLATLDPGSEGE